MAGIVAHAPDNEVAEAGAKVAVSFLGNAVLVCYRIEEVAAVGPCAAWNGSPVKW